MNAFEKYAAKKKLAYMLFEKIAAEPAAQQQMQQAQPAQPRVRQSMQPQPRPSREMNFRRGSTITANPSGQPTDAQRRVAEYMKSIGMDKLDAMLAKAPIQAPKFVPRRTAGDMQPGNSLSPFGKPAHRGPAPNMRTATSVGGPPPTKPTAVTNR